MQPRLSRQVYQKEMSSGLNIIGKAVDALTRYNMSQHEVVLNIISLPVASYLKSYRPSITPSRR